MNYLVGIGAEENSSLYISIKEGMLLEYIQQGNVSATFTKSELTSRALVVTPHQTYCKGTLGTAAMTTGTSFSRTELDLPFRTWKDFGFAGLGSLRLIDPATYKVSTHIVMKINTLKCKDSVC